MGQDIKKNANDDCAKKFNERSLNNQHALIVIKLLIS